MEPVSPLDDLRTLVEELPYWMTIHGGFIIARLERWIKDHGGEKPWSETREEKKMHTA